MVLAQIFYEIVLRWQLGLWSSEAQTGTGGFSCTHRAEDDRSLFLTTDTFPGGCLSILKTCQPASPRARIEQGGGHSVFNELASEVTLCHFCNILLSTQVGLFSVGGGYAGLNTTRWGLLGVVPRQPTTSGQCLCRGSFLPSVELQHLKDLLISDFFPYERGSHRTA